MVFVFLPINSAVIAFGLCGYVGDATVEISLNSLKIYLFK